MSDRYKIYLTNRFGTRQITPGNLDKIKKAWSEPDDNRLSLQETISGKLMVSGADFNWIQQQEKSSYRCEPIEVRIDKLCDGQYVNNYIQAEAYLNEADFDEDMCRAELALKVKNDFRCYDQNKSTEFNIMAQVFQRYTITVQEGEIEILNTNNDSKPAGDGWVIYSWDQQWDPDGTVRYWQVGWARLNNNGVYSQPYLINYTSSEMGTGTGAPGGYRKTYTYTIVGAQFSNIDNGMKLKDVLTKAIQFVCPSLNVKSDFFQINPDAPSSINYVTGQLSQVNNLLLFQKSDIKRPNADNNASIQLMDTEKLIENLCNIFNLRWDIIGSDFILEHVSYYSTRYINDITTERYKAHLFQKNKYSYSRDKLPKLESFKMMEQFYPDFAGLPIHYNSGCEDRSSSRKNEKTYEADFITTDFFYTISNPLPDNHPDFSGRITDKGFFLAACDNNFNLLSEPGIMDAKSPNNVLGWAHLHPKYWMHQRPQRRGTMNGLFTQFISEKPTKAGARITIPYCCTDVVEMNGYFKTHLGTGLIKSAEFSLMKETIELDLLYEADEFIVYDAPPVANDDKATTITNVPVEVDVLANDTDIGNNLDPTSIEIFTQENCTAVITAENKLLITPAAGFTGQAQIRYRVQDTANNTSNLAMVRISVLINPNAAHAGDDAYGALKNTTLDVAAPGLLANDSGVPTLRCIAETKATAHGTVEIFANGAFQYRPAFGYHGTDTFDYTIQGGNGATDVGTVNITISAFLYAKLITTNQQSSQIIEDCSGTPTNVGTTYYRDYQVAFYSDAAGTIPYAVDEMPVQVQILIQDPTANPPGQTIIKSYTLNGTKPTIETKYNYRKEIRGCTGNANIVAMHTFTIQPSPNFTIL
jgi:hypothetical protein